MGERNTEAVITQVRFLIVAYLFYVIFHQYVLLHHYDLHGEDG